MGRINAAQAEDYLKLFRIIMGMVEGEIRFIMEGQAKIRPEHNPLYLGTRRNPTVFHNGVDAGLRSALGCVDKAMGKIERYYNEEVSSNDVEGGVHSNRPGLRTDL